MALNALDYEQIKQLNARYCQSIDLRDVEGFLACFAVDGIFEGPGALSQGSEELRDFAIEVGTRTEGHGRHSQLSSLIDGDGLHARAVTYNMSTADYGAPLLPGEQTHAVVIGSGVYADDLVKIDGRWVYAKRSFTFDGTPDSFARLGHPLEISQVDTSAATEVDGRGMSALDYEAIRQLHARFSYSLDFQDIDGFAACFTSTGTFDELTLPDLGGHVRAEGEVELRGYAQNVAARTGGHSRRVSLSILIDGNGTTAQATAYDLNPMSYLFGYEPMGADFGQRHNPNVGTTGIYRDDLVKEDGHWLFKHRSLRYDGWRDVVDLVGKPRTFEQSAKHG